MPKQNVMIPMQKSHDSEATSHDSEAKSHEYEANTNDSKANKYDLMMVFNELGMRWVFCGDVFVMILGLDWHYVGIRLA